jgi:hypothetical protein
MMQAVDKGKDLAKQVKEKVDEIDIKSKVKEAGAKVKETGMKAIDKIKEAGEKVKEKGSEVAVNSNCNII